MKDLDFETEELRENPTSPIFSTSPENIDEDQRTTMRAELLQPWNPTKKEWLIMLSLSIISLMVALDATILVGVLPVRLHHS